MISFMLLIVIFMSLIVVLFLISVYIFYLMNEIHKMKLCDRCETEMKELAQRFEDVGK